MFEGCVTIKVIDIGLYHTSETQNQERVLQIPILSHHQIMNIKLLSDLHLEFGGMDPALVMC